MQRSEMRARAPGRWKRSEKSGVRYESLHPKVHRDLVAYGHILARETGQTSVEPAKLIVPMLVRFMSADRAFSKLRRGTTTPKTA